MDYVFSNANYETEKWEEGENVIIYCSWGGGGNFDEEKIARSNDGICDFTTLESISRRWSFQKRQARSTKVMIAKWRLHGSRVRLSNQLACDLDLACETRKRRDDRFKISSIHYFFSSFSFRLRRLFFHIHGHEFSNHYL